MDLSIIIVNFNSKDLADTCIRTIFHFPIAAEFEVILVDNASMDGSAEYLTDRWGNNKHFSIIRNAQNLGFGKANNIGIRQARGKMIATLNPDIEVHENTFNTLLKYMQEHSASGLIGPQLVYEDGVVQDSYRTFPRLFDILIKRTFLKRVPWLKNRLRRYLMWSKDKQKTENVDWLVGAFWLVRKTALDQTGHFDERFFLFFEDVDLCRRMWAKKWEVVYVPKAIATHHHERLSSGGLKEIFTKKTVRIHIQSALKYFWKWTGGKSTVHSRQSTVGSRTSKD